MRRAVTGFFMAWGMFWIVPCPLRRWDEQARPFMLLFLPWIGLLLGGAWGVCAWAFAGAETPLIRAAVLTALPLVLSGFIHLDGYMDCADAVLSRRDLDTRRSILKDSHVGAFGVIAVGILLLLEFALLSETDLTGRRLLCLVFIPAAARASAAAAVLTLHPLPTSGYARAGTRDVPGAFRMAAFLSMALFAAAAAVVCGWPGLCCAAAGEAGAWAAMGYIYRDLKGMSGDVSGAGITVGELCALAVLAAV